MPIYLLKRDECSYDEFDAKVVRAVNEEEARQIANQHIGDEGGIWTDPELVKCQVVEIEGASEEILGSFNAG